MSNADADSLAVGVRHPPAAVGALDALLLLVTVIWGTNYAVIKSAFPQLQPHAFNALRLIAASTVMAAASAGARRLPGVGSVFHTPAPVTRADRVHLAWLGLVGHGVYQFLFVGGLARSSVANSALIISSSPVVITLMSAVGGRERIGLVHWTGTLLSLAGICIVVGRGAHVSAASVRGDLMLIGAVACWAMYTVGAQPLMARHSPVGVTAISMIVGTVMYLPMAAPALAHAAWRAVGWATWAKLGYSAIFSMCVAYTIWYVAVREIGSARTAVYSNLMPIVAMAAGYVWLREPIGPVKLAGAATILAGVALTRRAPDRPEP